MEKITVEVEKYQAVDGQVFSSAYDCNLHESKLPTNDKLVESSLYDLRVDAVILRNVEDVETFLEESQKWIEHLAYNTWGGLTNETLHAFCWSSL